MTDSTAAESSSTPESTERYSSAGLRPAHAAVLMELAAESNRESTPGEMVREMIELAVTDPEFRKALVASLDRNPARNVNARSRAASKASASRLRSRNPGRHAAGGGGLDR